MVRSQRVSSTTDRPLLETSARHLRPWLQLASQWQEAHPTPAGWSSQIRIRATSEVAASSWVTRRSSAATDRCWAIARSSCWKRSNRNAGRSRPLPGARWRSPPQAPRAAWGGCPRIGHAAGGERGAAGRHRSRWADQDPEEETRLELFSPPNLCRGRAGSTSADVTVRALGGPASIPGAPREGDVPANPGVSTYPEAAGRVR